MTTKIVLGIVAFLTAEDGCVLTTWTEEQDILFYESCKKVSTSVAKVAGWREITEEQDALLRERKAVRTAALEAESGDEEDGGE